jgi:hypothetical protein
MRRLNPLEECSPLLIAEAASNFSAPTDKFKFQVQGSGSGKAHKLYLHIRTYPALEFHQFGLQFGVACRLYEEF